MLKLLDEKTRINGEKLALPTLEGYKFVNPKDIAYCKASGSYTYFFLRTEKKSWSVSAWAYANKFCLFPLSSGYIILLWSTSPISTNMLKVGADT